MNLREDVQRLIREQRLAHAYVILGSSQGNGLAFANDIITDLFSLTTEEPRERIEHRVHARLHPDVGWVEPSGAMRQIRVDDLKPVTKIIGEKSFEGGWKVVVFLHAERLNVQTANKFLKTLEEPPAKTLILMVTGSPEQLLDTIRSRCQLLQAPGVMEVDVPEWEPALLELLVMGPPRNLMERLTRSASFKNLFESIANRLIDEQDLESSEEEAEVEDHVLKGRESSLKRGLYREMAERIERWYRDVLVLQNAPESEELRYPAHREILLEQAGTLKPLQVCKLVENAGVVAKRLETNLPLQVVFESAVV